MCRGLGEGSGRAGSVTKGVGYARALGLGPHVHTRALLTNGGGGHLGLPEDQVTHPPTQADPPTHPPFPPTGGGVSHPSSDVY